MPPPSYALSLFWLPPCSTPSSWSLPPQPCAQPYVTYIIFNSTLLFVRHSYASYNYSAPRLPKGLTFSSTLHPVTTNAFTSGLFESTIDGQAVYNYCRKGGTGVTGQGGRGREGG